MNRIDFDQTGGYRLETESLSKLQSNYKIFEALGEVVGNKSIVKGCVTTGTNVSDGVIFYNGELLDFVGGQSQSTIIIIEEETNLLFEDGTEKPTFYKRYARFGSGIEAVEWSGFKRAYPLTSALYIDKIDMYGGDIDNIPEGWYLCDGQNGTRDLRGRFIVGYNPNEVDYNEIGKIGGEEKVTLTEAQIASHNHNGSFIIPPHTHGISPSALASGGGGTNQLSTSDNTGHQYVNETQASSALNGTLTTSNTGSDEAHENRPPFYTMAFIQFKGI